jgi:hypothetical protein
MENILAYDFGGGAMNVAIEEISFAADDSGVGNPRVLAALGGKDMKIMTHYSKLLKEPKFPQIIGKICIIMNINDVSGPCLWILDLEPSKTLVKCMIS